MPIANCLPRHWKYMTKIVRAGRKNKGNVDESGGPQSSDEIESPSLEITDIEKANHYLVSKSKAVDEANLVNKAQLEILEGEKERHLALIHELETVPLDLEGKYSA
ncbi:hypothetical protein V6N11_084102 [Hibiscus sabdariffa]|uniref:No apical meristem-associated C-terminal domain-containing protein n=1 Tax=Hibiscus sabdariffa TaxID=183260 RepID=A0ABR2QDV1_9ROSI